MMLECQDTAVRLDNMINVEQPVSQFLEVEKEDEEEEEGKKTTKKGKKGKKSKKANQAEQSESEKEEEEQFNVAFDDIEMLEKIDSLEVLRVFHESLLNLMNNKQCLIGTFLDKTRGKIQSGRMTLQSPSKRSNVQ